MRIVRIVDLALLGLVGCGGHRDNNDLCAPAVAHVFELTTVGPKPSHEEAAMIATIREAALATCRAEGLSRAQSDCILAAHYPEWSDQLRGCPAFAAKPASWVIVGPTRAQRQQLRGLPAVPDGPRESKRHFTQLVAQHGSTCGLTDAGVAQCWGEPLRAPLPSGTFVQLATSNDMTCGREAAGTLKCTLADPEVADRTPPDAFKDFAIDDYSGCGVRATDAQIECWNNLDDDPLAAPSGQFTSVTMNHGGACGRTVGGDAVCFGDSPPPPPPANVLAWSTDEGTCTIAMDHQLACTDTVRLGPTPTGRFDAVAIMRGHACATRSAGGTICWGENDAGECNVPQ
jgi:hypothetical protein